MARHLTTRKWVHDPFHVEVAGTDVIIRPAGRITMIVVNYGGARIERDVNGYRTIGDVLSDSGNQSVLGFSAGRVDAVVDGRICSAGDPTHDGDEINLVSKPNTKG